MNCPLCGTKVVYQGLSSVECSGVNCANYSPELKKSAEISGYEIWVAPKTLGGDPFCLLMRQCPARAAYDTWGFHPKSMIGLGYPDPSVSPVTVSRVDMQRATYVPYIRSGDCFFDSVIGEHYNVVDVRREDVWVTVPEYAGLGIAISFRSFFATGVQRLTI